MTGSKSLFGQNMLDFLDNVDAYRDSAGGALRYLITQGLRCPLAFVIKSLAPMDEIIATLCDDRPDVPLSRDKAAGGTGDTHSFEVTISSLGRVHIRSVDAPPPQCEERVELISIGYIRLPASLYREAQKLYESRDAYEASCFERVRAAVARLDREGLLAGVLKEVMGNVQHVESVCFYVGDRLLRAAEGTDNLVTGKKRVGYLNQMEGKPFDEWTDEQMLVVGALHSLFLSGRSVRFEEFNGLTLTAAALIDRLRGLFDMYRATGIAAHVEFGDDLFDVARDIRRMSAESVGKPWLRYRWIFGLSFYKTEIVLASMDSSEGHDAPHREFAELYCLLTGKPLAPGLDELRMFTEMARASLYKSLNHIALAADTGAATNWFEVLIQAIVASAVKATKADYGMSSSLRDLRRLITPPPEQTLDAVLELTTKDFYTCFVSNDMVARCGTATADYAASSCQKRMIFNRWHFIPGNFDWEQIPRTRHWYYPPLVPDIAIHSDIRRQGHARAYVKYSIRAPGPDMSRPPLRIHGVDYRGFYDVRVVRMTGQPFDTEDMLRARRRNLWMGALFEVLVEYLESAPESARFVVNGFDVGAYQDLRPHAVQQPLVRLQSATI